MPLNELLGVGIEVLVGRAEPVVARLLRHLRAAVQKPGGGMNVCIRRAERWKFLRMGRGDLSERRPHRRMSG